MKEMMALIVFLGMAAFAIRCAMKGYIGNGLTAILLTFSLISGLGIANYDLFQRIEWRMPGFSLFQKEVDQLKDQTIEEICLAGDAQKEELNRTLERYERAQETLAAAVKAAETLANNSRGLEEFLKKQEQAAKDQNARSTLTIEQLSSLSQSLSQLALLVTRVTWLQLQAAGETDATRRESAYRQAMEGLDALAELAIKDPVMRSDFVSNVINSLPAPSP